MNAQANLTEEPKPSKARWGLVVVGLIVVAVAVVIGRGRQADDAGLARALAGTWTATDPNDASLHRRELPVTHEQLVILADGTLTHLVELASKPGKPETDPWGWKVRKGRLYVQFRGDDASGQWLSGIPFSVSDEALSIRIKDHPPKEWVRR